MASSRNRVNKQMHQAKFEALLDGIAKQLTLEAQEKVFPDSRSFEQRTRELLAERDGEQIRVDFDPHPHVFPDICLGRYGIEVKFTIKDTWRSVANSVFESSRNEDVQQIYVLFGKMGGVPEVRWGHHESCVMHVRTSHVPRFEVEMYPETSLFEKFGTTYEEFHHATPERKMRYVRQYARARLKPGERLWWLDDRPEPEHSLPLQVRLYMHLPQDEKRALRAEAALLCPQVVKPPRSRNKYNDAVMYLMTHHGVLCPQARDLFSAGSVALRTDQSRGGNYVERALQDIEVEMRSAAERLNSAVFIEYWGHDVVAERRIAEWLRKADKLARDWRPSDVLFQGRRFT